ncbi:DUF2750 domain-containing protein [Colwellia sp. RE-S-Sl-9]
MTDQQNIIKTFMTDVKVSQTLWALKEPESENYVVLDSVNFENTEVMPLWSSAELAQNHCFEEWEDYQPTEISVAEWMEFWIEDLNEDNIIIGLNWPEEGDCVEVELAEFTQLLSEVEVYK